MWEGSAWGTLPTQRAPLLSLPISAGVLARQLDRERITMPTLDNSVVPLRSGKSASCYSSAVHPIALQGSVSNDKLRA